MKINSVGLENYSYALSCRGICQAVGFSAGDFRFADIRMTFNPSYKSEICSLKNFE